MLYSIIVNSINISDFVIKIGDVPVITRNEDYSLVVDGFDFKVTVNYTTAIAKNHTVLFYRGTTLLFNGYVKATSFDEETRLYTIEVSNLLEKLNNYHTDDDFDTIMDSFKENKTINGFSHEIISHYNLFNAIFNAIACTLDWTTFYVEKTDWTTSAVGIPSGGASPPTWTYPNMYSKDYVVTYLNVIYKARYDGVSATGPFDAPPFRTEGWIIVTTGAIEVEQYLTLVKDSELFYLPNQIICINQEKVWTPLYLNTEEGTRNRISLFELLSHLCSIAGYVFIPKSSTEFYVLNVKTNYSLTDDQIVSIDQEDKPAQSIGLSLAYKTLLMFVGSTNAYWFPLSAAQRYYYDDASTYNGNEAAIAEYRSLWLENLNNTSTLRWYNNFNPIILRDPNLDNNFDPYIVHPRVTVTFPCTYQIDAVHNDKIKKTIGVLYSDLPLRATPLSLKIIDINNDLLELEVLE